LAGRVRWTRSDRATPRASCRAAAASLEVLDPSLAQAARLEARWVAKSELRWHVGRQKARVLACLRLCNGRATAPIRASSAFPGGDSGSGGLAVPGRTQPCRIRACWSSCPCAQHAVGLAQIVLRSRKRPAAAAPNLAFTQYATTGYVSCVLFFFTLLMLVP